MTSNTKQALKNTSIYAYAIGEFGFTFFLLFVGYYLLSFLTDVLLLPSKIAATLYTLIQWFETITVVASGTIMDRFSFKNGRYRPWLMYGCFACLVGTVLFFTKFNLSVSAYIIIFPMFYLIAYWGYNFMWVAYRALNGIIGRTPNQTVNLTVTGCQMGCAASLIFSFVGVKLLHAFESIEKGYTVSAAIYCVVMVLCMSLVYRLAAPYDRVCPQGGGKLVRKKTVTLAEMIAGLKGPMLAYFISSTLRSSMTSVINALMVYHFNYNIRNSALMSSYMLSVAFGQLIGMFFVKSLVSRFGKKRMYIISAAASAVILSAAYFLAMKPGAFIACMMLNNFCAIFGGSLAPAFMNDIAVYNKVKRGIDTRGFTYSIGAAAIRLASIIGGAAASFGLVAIGYSGASAVTQSVGNSIIMLMTLFPAALMLLSIIPILFYRLDDKTMKEIVWERAAIQN